MIKRILNIFLITSVIIFTACKSESSHKPIMIDNRDTIFLPLQNIKFETSSIGWKAELLSFIQPIPLDIHYNKKGLVLSKKSKHGILEGPGKICLSNGNDYFYFNVYLKNSSTPIINEIDYRSPKTVNTDSSLVQQKLIFKIDHWRNIAELNEEGYFFDESQLKLTELTGTYRAQAEIPLSSYYVQSGSCVSIPIKYEFLKHEKQFKIIAGPLKDKFNNLSADGTVVKFYFNVDSKTHLMEKVLLKGFAEIELSAVNFYGAQLYAEVKNTQSKTIILEIQ